MDKGTREAESNKDMIIETVNRLFISVDERNWDQVLELFADTVLLDYTSMAGGSPATLPAQQITEAWKGLLPGFDQTHHHTGNFIVEYESGVYKVFCYGTATHYLKNKTNNNVWTVVGSYNFEISIIGSRPRISKMKFNLKYTDGNNDLPGLAQEKLKKQPSV